MTITSNVQITIALKDSDLDDEKLQEETENLLQQMRALDEVEDANLVADPNPPERGKGGGFLLGLLTAEVNAKNIKALFQFLSDRLGGKPIKLALKTPDGREINLEASSREEFEFVMHKAQDFLKNT
jgi:ferric-dicitrate binding protein FerR (iron transport regulator)